jgi:catechol 2,3-dioxygenase-like lactoylglutathione lyase family enzyme
MKRFHVHVAVNDLNKSIAFYSAMFGQEPTAVETDYAKWMLEDPRVNFAISDRGQAPGINHLGFQAEDDAELEAIHANLQRAGTAIASEMGANCCYAKSDKYWVTDPQGITWESFRSLGSIPLFSSAEAEFAADEKVASCGSGEASNFSCCASSESKAAVPVKAASGCCAKA